MVCNDEGYVDGIRIAWFFDEEGDYGAILGEEVYTAADLLKSKVEGREHILATVTASLTDGVERDERGYSWTSIKKARCALKAIKAALKHDVGPWPEWAVKAQAEGWKAPKGWKP